MVRETRHLWVGNLPENIREERIKEHFKRYGRVQSIKLLPSRSKEETSEGTLACTVAFMDIKSAAKAHTADHKLDDRTLTTEYYEPTAIPSAENTSTSPGNTRFSNSHSSSEEHGSFGDRFYERGVVGSGASGDYLRRSSTSTYLQETARGRTPRDRLYGGGSQGRNGPYAGPPLIDRPHRTSSSSWTSAAYDGANARYPPDPPAGYAAPATPAPAEQVPAKKKTQSRSGSKSRSPSPEGSVSSRSPSRSRSRSSSTSSASSTSRGSSSRTSSPKSRRVQSSINASHTPIVHSEDRRPLAICVRNLPARSSDTSLKDGLFHEYKKHGKVTWVKVVGQSSDRYAIVCFKKPDDVEKALEVSYDKLFFGCKIEVAPYQGYDVDDNEFRPYEAELDEFHPKATRTLFIGNLEKDVTASELRKHFDQFGEIIEIDIKKQGAVSSYAFCQYSDIVSVVKAMRTMDGEHLGNNRIKLGFGKSMPTNCVWVDGVADSVNEKYLTMQFDPYGTVTQVNIDRERGHALIFYEQVICAQTAVKEMRGLSLRGRKLQVDFASRECQESFYEHLEKQGHVAERPGFEERRDSSCKSFETATLTSANRFTTKYDTPTRPRTASYSSRSGSQSATAAIPSPGTPGSVTPRGSSSRSRISRYDYYEGGEYPSERRFRNYDEFSQGSGASHEDGYDHEYAYARDSPSHIDGDNARVLPSVVVSNDHQSTPFAPPDIRHLQKERVHLLEQLEECPSSGDELMSPKKRLKMDLQMNGNVSSSEDHRNEHRKLLDVRRLSESSVKHHSRRPSVDGKHLRDLVPDRGGNYMPHAVCKRRKTAGSDSGSRIHHHELSGSESVGSSRPGTPLCDERPEHFTPSEPRRIPREREGPLSLPLPRFAAQVLGKGLNISIAGFKNQPSSKESVASSPPTAATSPRIPNPVPPSPVHVPPPASPPPRPPSLSSNSSDSDVPPPSPSLEERIRSLDEKYEKWSGSRALSAAGGDALAKLDASAAERFRFRHKLLVVDLKEVQPSEIVKSVMAKRSVFDEDTKRLENVGEKYEPKEFGLYPRPALVSSQPATPPPTVKTAVPTLQLPKTPTPVAAAAIAPAKGLQYPFPSHPPCSTSSRITSGAPHGDSRLKPCPSVPASDRTTSKVNVNRIGCASVVPNSGGAAPKPKSDSFSSNIPVIVNANCENEPLVNKSPPKSARKDSGDKPSRRDSASSLSSSSSTNSKHERKESRDSESECDRKSETCDKKLEAEKRKAAEEEEAKRLRAEREREEREQREQKEREERERLEKERQEKERLAKEKQEKERQERLEQERLEKERLERLERERKQREREERERKEQEERELERERQEKLEKERQREREKREKEERERREREEKERREREEQLEKARQERERLEKLEKERQERKREKEDEKHEKNERKHKADNHDRHKDKDEIKHRENHSETKKDRDESGKQNHMDCVKIDKHRDSHESSRSNAKESKDHEVRVKENHESSRVSELTRKDSHQESTVTKNNHKDNDKSRHENDRRKDNNSSKENRDNNQHDKSRHFSTESRENSKDRHSSIDSRHMSTDSEKSRTYSESKSDSARRKEKTTSSSAAAALGNKRRLSSQDSNESVDEAKRIKLSSEHRKLSERRDSKDSKSSDKSKPNKHTKNNVSKTTEEKTNKDDKQRPSDDKARKDKEREREKEDRYKSKKDQKSDKQKVKTKSSSKDEKNRDSPTSGGAVSKAPPKEPSLDNKDFLAKLELRATEEVEKQRQLQRKEVKDKRKQEMCQSQQQQHHQQQHQQQPQQQQQQPQLQHQLQQQQSQDEERKYSEEQQQRKKEKRASSERRSRDEASAPKSADDKSKNQQQQQPQQPPKKERIRKFTNSSDTTDSDEPKKHSIFDIVVDEPAYISMYDKVKARSCKNMQKQEEEKRQEKIKAKFSQLKQSRAKREEKKRSTSWDEDSDSECDRTDNNSKRRGKINVITSSSEDEMGESKHHRQKKMSQDVYSDSDMEPSSKPPSTIKQEIVNSSDEDSAKVNKSKCSKRIASESSDDEYNRKHSIKFNSSKIKTEITDDADNINNDYDECEDKSVKKIKDEYGTPLYDDKYIKKEKKNAKHHGMEDIMSQSKVDLKTEVFSSDVEHKMPKIENSRHNHKLSINCDASSEGENQENKKGSFEKSESRKKHKKKQKRQKSLLLDEANKQDKEFESTEDQEQNIEKVKNPEKKKHSSKKEKKRDKIKEKKIKDKKLNKLEFSDISSSKRDEKMEDIFGPLSDDSDTKDHAVNNHGHKHNNSYIDSVRTYNEKLQVSYIYGSDSDNVMQPVDVNKERNTKEEHRKRKEKKRKEKERRLREENENSVDFMGRVLEANLTKEESMDVPEPVEETVENSVSEDVVVKPETPEICKINDNDNSNDNEKEIEAKREVKEKKKKRKKSKEEKQNRHHHHHHDRNADKSEKIKSPDYVKKEPPTVYVEEAKAEEPEDVKPVHSSLPSLLDIPSPPHNKASPNMDYAISPITREPIVSPIPKTPTSSSKDKKRDKFIPGFGTEIDEQMHENAVKSISDFESPIKEESKEIKIEDIPKSEKAETSNEEKQRVVISQEETEDAVAALLGESFGGSEFNDTYDVSQNSPPNIGASSGAAAAEDDEEMRQAVQSLSSADIDAKPDTPQSEHELQIDTDTEENEELTGLRDDQPPRTPDMVDLSQPPKTPDLPASYYRAEQAEQQAQPKPIVINSLEPPMLTPIVKVPSKPTPAPAAPAASAEQTRSVITQSWSMPSVTSESETLEAKADAKKEEPKAEAAVPLPPPQVKITEPENPSVPNASAKEPQKMAPVSAAAVPVSTSVKIVPIRTHHLPLQAPKQQLSISSSGLLTPLTTISQSGMNLMPITTVMASRTLQASTTVMPQAKTAHVSTTVPVVSTSADMHNMYHSNNVRIYTSSPIRAQRPQLPAPDLVSRHVLPTNSYGLQQPGQYLQFQPSVIEKTVRPIPPLITEPPKLVPTAPYSHETAAKQTLQVVQETKLLSPRSPQTCVIQQTVAKPPGTPVPSPKAPQEEIEIKAEAPKAPAPSPVIVCVKEAPAPAVAVAAAKQQQQEAPTPKPEVPEIKIEAPKSPAPTPPPPAPTETKDDKKWFDNTAKPKEETKDEVKEETPSSPSVAPAAIKDEEPAADVKKEPESVSVIKETDKYEEDKHEDTESVVSDASKERLSAEILSAKDDPLDSKEDSDYWSAKEVNIDSVIKKVDQLCSADELSEGSSEMGKDEWFDNCIKSNAKPSEKEDFRNDHLLHKSDGETDNIDEGVENFPEEKESLGRGARRGGRRVRGGGAAKNKSTERAAGVVTRRGKTVKEPPKRGAGGGGARGGRAGKERKTRQSDSDPFGDVYEFRDDSDENKDRPRLILTIKSPQSNVPNAQVKETPAVKDTIQVPKPVVREPSPQPQRSPQPQPQIQTQTQEQSPVQEQQGQQDQQEEFVSPASNTRKSRRLQAKDGSRNTVDDTIEDVVKNISMVTRSASAAAQATSPATRRSTRLTVVPPPKPQEPRKSPRAVRKKDRRSSETAEDSSEEKPLLVPKKEEAPKPPEPPVAAPIPEQQPQPQVKVAVVPDKVETPREKPHEGLKAAVLRRVKNEEPPTSLIDPVTGLLTPMRECEEGKYIPVARVTPHTAAAKPVAEPPEVIHKEQPAPAPAPVPAAPTPRPVIPPPVAVEPEAKPPPPSVITSSAQPTVLVQQQPQQPQQQKVPQSRKAHVLQAQVLSQQASAPLPMPQAPPPPQSYVVKSAIPVSQNLNINVNQMMQQQDPLWVKQLPQPPMSPAKQPPMQHSPQPPQPIIQTVKSQQAHPVINPKQHILNSVAPIQIPTHLKMPTIAAMKPVTVKASPPIIKQHSMSLQQQQQQQVLAATAASPPLKPSHHITQQQQPIVIGAANQRKMEPPPKVEVSMAGCVLVPHPSASPQARHVLQPGMPVPTAYEATMHGVAERAVYTRTHPQSPPPAHQNSPSPQGEIHFAPGPVPIRTTHEIPPAHYMAAPHVMYQQFLRQGLNLRSPLLPMDKPPMDGQEGEEAPVTSPPLELRRPGSVGLALTSRPPGVPLGLHSPHDRATDSPQVYSIHNAARLPPHYHPAAGRYYDAPNEPPPAHRPLTSHASLAGTLGPGRPLTSHAGLGNHPLVGRHLGAVAPASQRGALQAATPPHASQVPPQTESLLMLLKQYPCMWQGLLALKNDQAAVQMHFVSGNDAVAKYSLPKYDDGSTPPLRIFQRMRLEPPQVEGVSRKMQIDNEHCMLLALPCGHDHKDVLQQSNNLKNGFITYLQKKQAAGIVNVAAPGTTQPPAYVVHIFPSCDFVNENLRRIAPSLLERVADVAHLLIVITTV